MIPLIYGFNKSCEIGEDNFYPTIFLKGCNLKCPYCMNGQLVTGENLTSINQEEISDYIKSEHPKMIMISGGEPTMDIDGLMELFKWIGSYGCNIGIATNGTYPENLKIALEYYRLLYVALDLKGYPYQYVDKFGSKNDSFFSVIDSWNQLRKEKLFSDGFNYEIRTTLYRPVINSNSITFLGKLFNKGEPWVLQNFRIVDNMLDDEAKKHAPYTQQELSQILDLAKFWSEADVEIRSV
jgi:pyruvate formate lyase activating enzyme